MHGEGAHKTPLTTVDHGQLMVAGEVAIIYCVATKMLFVFWYIIPTYIPISVYNQTLESTLFEHSGHNK